MGRAGGTVEGGGYGGTGCAVLGGGGGGGGGGGVSLEVRGKACILPKLIMITCLRDTVSGSGVIL